MSRFDWVVIAVIAVAMVIIVLVTND